MIQAEENYGSLNYLPDFALRAVLYSLARSRLLVSLKYFSAVRCRT